MTNIYASRRALTVLLSTAAASLLLSGCGDAGQAATTTTTAKETTTTAPKSPADALHDAIAKKLGSGRKGVQRLSEFQAAQGGTVSMKVAFNDRLTEGMTKDGGRIDVRDIITAVKASSIDADMLVVQGTYSMKDAYGNVSEQVVTTVRYSRATLARINPKEIETHNVFDVADSASVVPAFRY
jgi:hypothetical protein